MSGHQSKEVSPLLRLPAELRDEIYRLAAPLKYHEVFRSRLSPYRPRQRARVFTTDMPPPEEPALLYVNRQVRQEASAVYYKKNRFTFMIEDLNARTYIKWCKASPARRKANVAFTFHYDDRFDPETHRKRNPGGKGEVRIPLAWQLWPHLLYWLEQYYHRECLGIPISTEGHKSHFTNTAAAVFEMVGHLGKECDMTWPQVEKTLESTRRALGAANGAWFGVVKYAP